MTQTVLPEGVRIKGMPFQIIDGDRGINYPKGHEFSESGFCLFLSAKNVTRDGFNFAQKQFVSAEKDVQLGKGKLQREDVVLTTRGTVGNVAIYDGSVPFEDIRINSGMVIFRCNKEKMLPSYLNFVLKSAIFQNQVENFRSGSAQPQLPIRDMQNMRLPLPSLDEQREVAGQVGTIDEKIELNRRMNETLEQMGQALFRHYFIDNPDAEKWASGVLEDVLGVTMGQSPPGSSYNIVGDGAVFYQGRAEFGIRFPNQRLSTVDPKRLAKRGDVLLSVRAPVGDINQATENCCIGRGLAAISSTEGFESYCYYLMKYLQPRFADFNSEGTVFGAINGKQLKELKTIISPVELRQEFDDAAKSLDAQIWNNSEQIQTLTTLRDTLLPRLINGKVKL